MKKIIGTLEKECSKDVVTLPIGLSIITIGICIWIMIKIDPLYIPKLNLQVNSFVAQITIYLLFSWLFLLRRRLFGILLSSGLIICSLYQFRQWMMVDDLLSVYGEPTTCSLLPYCYGTSIIFSTFLGILLLLLFCANLSSIILFFYSKHLSK